MIVNLRLKDSDTWVCRRDGHIDETFVKGAALTIELTEEIKEIIAEYEDMIEAVPVTTTLESI